MFKKAIGLFVLMFAVNVYAVDLPLPNEPPVQVSDVEVVGGYTGLTWDANTEEDLAGYLIGYSVGSAYVYNTDNIIDVGNVTQFLFDALPSEVKQDGNQVYFAAYAYDLNGNVSERSETVSISFLADPPPGSPTGLKKQ